MPLLRPGAAASAALVRAADEKLIEGFAETVPHALLAKAASALAAAHPEEAKEYSLGRLLKGCTIEFEKPKPRIKSPEYIKLMNDIRAQLAEREYESMVCSVARNDFGRSGSSSSGSKWNLYELSLVWRQSLSIMNILFSIVAVFAGVFVFAERVVQDAGFRVLLALLASAIVGFAEGWFFTRDWLLDHDENKSKPKQSTQYRPFSTVESAATVKPLQESDQ